MATTDELTEVIAAVRGRDPTTYHSNGSAELLVAEIDALRAAVLDAAEQLKDRWHVGSQQWGQAHGAVITRAMEAKP